MNNEVNFTSSFDIPCSIFIIRDAHRLLTPTLYLQQLLHTTLVVGS